MKFECQSSCGGKCCTAQWDKGERPFVFLTKEDKARLSKALNFRFMHFIERKEFISTRFKSTRSLQYVLKLNAAGRCPFLDNGKCGIYENRPTQCRTFPFWPEYRDKAQFDKLKEICPGVGKGEEKTGPDLFDEQFFADYELREEG